jgi:hypothetical protein
LRHEAADAKEKVMGRRGEPAQSGAEKKAEAGKQFGPAKVEAKAEYPQLLRELEAETKTVPRFNKHSQEFSIDRLNQTAVTVPTAASMQIPSALGFSSSALAGGLQGKDEQAGANTNNYSNNMFSQTIFIGPHGMPADAAKPPLLTPAAPLFGLQMPPLGHVGLGMGQPGFGALPFTGVSPQYLGMLQLAGLSQPAMGLMNPQMMAMMQLMQQAELAQTGGVQFDEQPAGLQDLSEEQMLMHMLEAFQQGTPDDDADDLDQILAEEHFEQEQAEADQFQPESRECTCCFGYPLKCAGEICQNLGTCHCVLRRTKEEDAANQAFLYVEDRSHCNCCKGYVYACKGAACVAAGRCKCLPL